MAPSIRVGDRLDGAINFRSWKTMILPILKENELQDHVEKIILELYGVVDKSKYKKNETKEKIILIDSIKDHFIPHVDALKTTKEVYDALVALYESSNTSNKLTLRNHLRLS